MKYQDFLGQVQARARLASLDAAVKATRAVLMTLGSSFPHELRPLLVGSAGPMPKPT